MAFRDSGDAEYFRQIISMYKTGAILTTVRRGPGPSFFTLPYEDIKRATGRQRLGPSIVEQYVQSFRQQGMEASCDDFAIYIAVDLDRCYLTAIESKNYLDQMRRYYEGGG